jgi:hypothetical protein
MPFARGNTIGRATWFKPGQSGNPYGFNPSPMGTRYTWNRVLHASDMYRKADQNAGLYTGKGIVNAVREALKAYRVTQAQAARICSVSARHVRRWCASPELASARLIPVKRWWTLLSVLESLPANFKAFPRYQRDEHIERLRGAR